MAIEDLESPPVGDNVLQGEPWKDGSRLSNSGTLAKGFLNWLFKVQDRFKRAPDLVAHVSGEAVGAALATTPLLVVDADGLYRVGYVGKVRRPATVSSAFQFTIGYTRNGNVCAVSGSLQNGNLATTWEGQDVDIRADHATSITGAISYASVGGTPMLFDYDFIVEAITN